MLTKRIELQEGTVVEITAHEDLTILGGEEAALVITVDEEEESGAFHVAEDPGKVTIELLAEARLQVWQACPLVVREANGDLSMRGTAGTLEIVRSHGDVALSSVGEVKIGSMGGDLAIRRAGAVHCTGLLHDDVSLRHVGAVELNTVGGDLHVHRAESLGLERVEDDLVTSGVAGEVRLQVVQGDASLRQIGGAVEIGRVEGDLHVHGVLGDLAVTHVRGDVHMDVRFQADRRYTVACQNDITVRVREGPGVRFHIQSPRWEACSKASFQVESQEGDHTVVRIGDGAADVYLAADGKVMLGPVVGDWDETFRDFGRRMEAWGAEFGQQMEVWGEQLREGMAQSDWEHVGREVEEAAARVAQVVESRMQEIDVEEIKRRAEREARRLEQQMREVDWERIGHKVEEATRHGMERVQVGLERLRKRMEREGLGVPPVPPIPPTPPTPPTPPEPSRQIHTVIVEGPELTAADETSFDPVTDEERMAVLRLVEEGRLSADEAAALLDALDGAAC